MSNIPQRFPCINVSPSQPKKDHATSDTSATFRSFEDEARRTLRRLQPQLDVPERLITTGELGKLGETVPRVLCVAITLSAHPGVRAIISISGSDIQPGVQLLVDGQMVEGDGAFEHGAYVVTANCNGNQHPRSIGIPNPDDTTAQAAAIAMTAPSCSSLILLRVVQASIPCTTAMVQQKDESSLGES
jgi:hypothetical protein